MRPFTRFQKTSSGLSISRFGFLLFVAVSAHVFAQPARVAVVGDPSLGDLIDVTTAQLSSQPGVSVLERADLNSLGREQALQAVMASNDFSSIQTLPADGLIILRAVQQGGKTGVFVRLIAVQPGIVLREVPLPDGVDPETLAKSIAYDFASYWPKLAAIQKGKITALSLLGLRFEVDGPKTRAMERKINVLLASRLSAEPDVVVLERWRLNDALFEKSLNAQPPAPFWTGGSLIDGSMKSVGDQVQVTLRVRPPQGAEISISDQDKADQLPPLIDRLADKIRSHPMTQAAWQPAAEADHYAKLGKWCLDNGLYDEGAEAIESALALGDNSPATHRLQIQAYKSLTYTDELPNAESSFDPEAVLVAPESIPARVKWGTTAANLACDYLLLNHDFSGPPGSPEDPVAVSLPVLDNGLRLLRFTYQKGFARDDEAETTTLRHAVQNLISQMEPVLEKRPPDQRAAFLTYEVRFAPYWHETPEATVAYYRDLLNRKTDGSLIRNELFVSRYFVLHPATLLPQKELPTFDPNAGSESRDWYDASPWILAWDNRPPAELAAIWANFQKELATSPDPILQADAIKFGFSRAYTRERRPDEDGTRLVALLEQNQESFYGPRGNDLLIGFHQTLYDIAHATNRDNIDRLRVLGDALLKKRAILAPEWIRWMPKLYYQISPATGAELLASLDAYRQWYQTQVPQDAEMVNALDEARRPLAAYAGAVPASRADDFITVNRHWQAPTATGGGGLEAMGSMLSMIFAPSLTTAENKVWFMMFGGTQILCVDPSTLQTVSSFSIPDQLVQDRRNSPGGCCLGVTPQFLIVAVFGHVLLCSRADNNWRALDLPASNYKPCWVNQQLYLIYDTESDLMDYRQKGEGAASAISGLIHVSLSDGGIENLVSTRRIPPQSALDGKPLGYPLDLWSSPTGLMLAVDADSPHFQVFGTAAGKNDWASTATDPMWCDVKVGAGGALVGKSFNEYGFAKIVLLNGTDRELLLSNPNRVPASGASTARWDIPDEIRTTSPQVNWQASPVMRGDDLCLYRDTMNATNDRLEGCLYYFAKGQKSGLKIPLRFPSQGDQNAKMVRMQAAILDYQSLRATDYGLVIVQARGGFWVIPWSDIDAYRARSASATSPAALSPLPVPSTP